MAGVEYRINHGVIRKRSHHQLDLGHFADQITHFVPIQLGYFSDPVDVADEVALSPKKLVESILAFDSSQQTPINGDLQFDDSGGRPIFPKQARKDGSEQPADLNRTKFAGAGLPDLFWFSDGFVGHRVVRRRGKIFPIVIETVVSEKPVCSQGEDRGALEPTRQPF